MTGERLTQIPSTAHRLQHPRRRVFGRVMAIALASVLVSPIAAAPPTSGSELGPRARSPCGTLIFLSPPAFRAPSGIRPYARSRQSASAASACV